MQKVKIEYTKQGYSYIKCTPQECFNWGGMAVCDQCGIDMEDEVYLVFILGSAMCKKCFEEWCSRARKYPEDIILQNERHIAYYKAHGFEIEELESQNENHIPRID